MDFKQFTEAIDNGAIGFIEIKSRRKGSLLESAKLMAEGLKEGNTFYTTVTDKSLLRIQLGVMEKEFGVKAKFDPVYTPVIKALYLRKQRQIEGYKISLLC